MMLEEKYPATFIIGQEPSGVTCLESLLVGTWGTWGIWGQLPIPTSLPQHTHTRYGVRSTCRPTSHRPVQPANLPTCQPPSYLLRTSIHPFLLSPRLPVSHNITYYLRSLNSTAQHAQHAVLVLQPYRDTDLLRVQSCTHFADRPITYNEATPL